MELKELLDVFHKLIQDKEITIVFLGIIVYIIHILFKMDYIKEYISYLRRNKWERFEDSLNLAEGYPEICSLIREKRLEYSLSKSLKVRAEFRRIEALVKLYYSLDRKYTFNRLIKMSRYLKLCDDGKMEVSINKVDRFGYWFNNLFGWGVLGIAIFMLCYVFILNMFFDGGELSNADTIIFTILGTGLSFLGMVIVSDNIPYENARKLQNELSSSSDSTSQQTKHEQVET
ncbi:hypothetical protein ACIRXL_07065 [Avibacterium paragallinarum]|uniref:hypothetical protein n=1 Tax=Avibacterium paragallinarum TaxID=728 RepID=UPI0039793BBA